MLSDWRPFDAWREAGARTATERAGEIHQRLLASYEAPAIDPARRERLDAYVSRRREQYAHP